MRIECLSIRDPAVQQFLWEHIQPGDFRHDYTKLDALRYLEAQCLAGDAHLYGDLSVPFVFYAVQRNPRVIEPHIMGDGRKLREAMAQGAKLAWAMGYERALIWTWHERIARICVRAGYSLEAAIPQAHLAHGTLHTLYCVTISRDLLC